MLSRYGAYRRVEHDRGLANDPALAVVKADLQIPQGMAVKVQSQFAQDKKKARITNNSLPCKS